MLDSEKLFKNFELQVKNIWRVSWQNWKSLPEQILILLFYHKINVIKHACQALSCISNYAQIFD